MMTKDELIIALTRSSLPGDAQILVWRAEGQRLTTEIKLREVGAGQIVIEEVGE
ncbi:hypothetical protein MHB71_04930 [Paenibacillus sp. FSL H7-0940]|uniref:hypothetical protein n=1 Tax=Paenibacillus sp. FSL H7-0940 TaxID=2921443 RepID=UPI0030EE95BC